MDRVAQSRQALEKANRHRLAVAAKRRELGELGFEDGREALAHLLLTCEDPAILSGRGLAGISRPQSGPAPRRAGQGPHDEAAPDHGQRRLEPVPR